MCQFHSHRTAVRLKPDASRAIWSSPSQISIVFAIAPLSAVPKTGHRSVETRFVKLQQINHKHRPICANQPTQHKSIHWVVVNRNGRKKIDQPSCRSHIALNKIISTLFSEQIPNAFIIVPYLIVRMFRCLEGPWKVAPHPLQYCSCRPLVSFLLLLLLNRITSPTIFVHV